MKILELQFRVPDRPRLDATTRSLIEDLGEFPPIPLSKCTQIWHGSIPNQIRISLNVHGSAVFITDDWVTSIYGRRLIDCVGALCAILSTLGEACSASVTVRLLTTHGSSTELSLDRQNDGKVGCGQEPGMLLPWLWVQDWVC